MRLTQRAQGRRFAIDDEQVADEFDATVESFDTTNDDAAQYAPLGEHHLDDVAEPNFFNEASSDYWSPTAESDGVGPDPLDNDGIRGLDHDSQWLLPEEGSLPESAATAVLEHESRVAIELPDEQPETDWLSPGEPDAEERSFFVEGVVGESPQVEAATPRKRRPDMARLVAGMGRRRWVAVIVLVLVVAIAAMGSRLSGLGEKTQTSAGPTATQKARPGRNKGSVVDARRGSAARRRPPLHDVRTERPTRVKARQMAGPAGRSSEPQVPVTPPAESVPNANGEREFSFER